MIPFARMLEYGNIVVKKTIKKVECSSVYFMVLMDDGTLFGSGSNSSGQLGTGNTSGYTGTYGLSNISNVKDVFTGSQTTVVVTNDNKVFYCGNNAFLGLGGTNVTTWTECTQLFLDANIQISTMKVYLGFSSMLVLNGTTLMGIGDSDFGASGSASSWTAFSQRAANVREVFVCPNARCSFYISTTGLMFSTGRNTYGNLGLGSANRVNTFTRVTSIVKTVKTLFLSGDSTAILCDDGTLYTCGERSFGQQGDGYSSTTSNIRSAPALLTPVPFVGTDILLNRSPYGYSNGSQMICVGNTLYSTGFNLSGLLSLGTAGNVASYTQGILPVSDISSYTLSMGNGFAILWNADNIYMSGNPSLVIGNLPSNNLFQLVRFPT